MDKAVVVGINAYPGSPLRGCVNDATDVAALLVERCGFAAGDVRMLVDARATATAILERLAWLVGGLRAGDRAFFHYSGHGSQVPTRSPAGEVDGLDEVICPVDFDWTDGRTIRDKDFARIFAAVPEGVEFVWVSDSCHSGDLSRAPGGAPRTLTPPADLAWRRRGARERGLRPLGMARAARACRVALVPGCRADQNSADAVFEGRPGGALTHGLVEALRETDGLAVPLREIVARVRKRLRAAGFEQEPYLEGSAEIAARPFLAAARRRRAA